MPVSAWRQKHSICSVWGIRCKKYCFRYVKSIRAFESIVFVEFESSPATEVLFFSNEMLGDARSTHIVLLLSQWLPLVARENKYFLRFADSRRCFFDDPMELLRRARIRFRLTKLILLAREQFIKNVWSCTRNGFGSWKPLAERSLKPNVLFLSSGMPQGAQTTVFVVPENAMALKLRVSSSENSHRSNHYICSVKSFLNAETITIVVPIVFNDFCKR